MAYPTGELSVDLHAIVQNWRLINGRLNGAAECGAVVKANAYGLGVDRISPQIYKAGCRHFFVANLKEAMQLRSFVGMDANIYVLAGCIAGAESTFIEKGIWPVIVSYEMLKRWAAFAKSHDNAKAMLKVDTGMGRLGIGFQEFETLLDDRELLKQAKIKCLMSHLACAEEPEHPLNKKQIERFEYLKEQLANSGISVKTSLANSAGVFLGSSVHCDIVRPGIALYGGNPGLNDNPMNPVVGLTLPIIQVKKIPAGEYVGYGATRVFPDERTIAIVSGGYADGIMRSLSNKGWGYVNGKQVSIVGRVSMDTTVFDVTEVADDKTFSAGSAIELLGKHVSIDDFANAADTISYEVLTSLGGRYQRCYVE